MTRPKLLPREPSEAEIERIARAVWDAREATFPQRVRVPYCDNEPSERFGEAKRDMVRVMAKAARLATHDAAPDEPTDALVELVRAMEKTTAYLNLCDDALARFHKATGGAFKEREDAE